jgi:hypothetical protein
MSEEGTAYPRSALERLADRWFPRFILLAAAVVIGIQFL